MQWARCHLCVLLLSLLFSPRQVLDGLILVDLITHGTLSSECNMLAADVTGNGLIDVADVAGWQCVLKKTTQQLREMAQNDNVFLPG